MPDRIPIGTIPGLTSQLDAVDILIATLGVAATVTRVLVRHTDYDDGGATDTSVVGSLRNATGGGGSGIAFTIPDQAQSVVATGSLALAASDSLYLRVSAGSESMNLTGWVEISGAAGVTTALTTLAKVKAFLGITGSDDDDLLNTLIAAVSDEIQKSPMGVNRQILQATATGEKVDVPLLDHRILLLHYPVLSIASLTEAGTALVEDTDFEIGEQDKAIGQVVRISGDEPIAWARGLREVVVTYDHGYASVPDAVCQAATELVAFDYLQSAAGGRRLGLSNKPVDEGGSPGYVQRSEIWKSHQPRLSAYRARL